MPAPKDKAAALDIEYGRWFTPAQAAPHIPGAENRRAVYKLCESGEIEHVLREYDSIDPQTGRPRVRYFISEKAIRAYIRRHTKRAA